MSSGDQVAQGMQRWAGKVALVTGASDGIGRAIAIRLLKCGMKIIGCGRRIEALEKLKADIGGLGDLTIMQCDVSKEEQVLAMFANIKEKFGKIDVCINNAGLGRDASILSGKSEDWQLMLDTNVMGVLRVTREATSLMKAGSIAEGHIININSLSGHRLVPNPSGHVYTATKFALTAITNGIRVELLTQWPDFKCRVSQISPGLVETPFIKHHVGEEKATQLFQQLKALEAEDLAEAVVYQLGSPPHVQIQDVLLRSIEQTA